MSVEYVFPGIRGANEFNLSKGGYYVYGWACADWGDIYYYIGKGTGDRYCSTRNRGSAFMAILNNWTVYPVILYSGLTVEEAEKLEDELKTDFIFNRGYPIMDGEGNSASLKNRAIRLAKQHKRETDPNWREGRKQVATPDFEKFLKKQKDGEMTVVECCEALGISRRTWYNRVSEVG
jgi:hypothetical protein